MLKLAYDFSRRAVKTWRGKPVAAPGEQAFCGWGAADLAPKVSGAVAVNELDRLSESVLAVASTYKHSRGRGFQDHLQGVAGLLQRWQQDALVVQTGLLHSAYSTQQYPYGLYQYSERDALRELIGVDGERLVFLFCSHDRVDFYSKAVALARSGQAIPEGGMQLRNALTGATALVPPALLVPLAIVHAADLAEQMDGFNFDIVAALLSVAAPWSSPPGCLAALLEAGVSGDALQINIEPSRGTFGLAPVLGLNRRLLRDRFRLLRLLRGKDPLTSDESQELDAIDARLPGLFEVPWIRYRRAGASNHEAQSALAEARARHRHWGVPWLKRPFDGNKAYERLILSV